MKRLSTTPNDPSMYTSSFDIVDDRDNPVHQVEDYETVHRLGLWVRGVHVIVYTPERDIVMQKRAPSLAYHPDEVEISVGGGVDAGEAPEAAAIREVHEELGITISNEQLRFIGKTKFNHRTKTQYHRTFIYSYAVCLPKEQLQLTTDPTETSLAFFMNERQLRRALRRHRIRHIGKISSLYAYWRYLLDAITTN